jgi:hypothetical protein
LDLAQEYQYLIPHKLVLVEQEMALKWAGNLVVQKVVLMAEQTVVLLAV